MTDSGTASADASTASVTEMWNTTGDPATAAWGDASLSLTGSGGTTAVDEYITTSNYSMGSLSTPELDSTMALAANDTVTLGNFSELITMLTNVTEVIVSSSQDTGTTEDSMTTSQAASMVAAAAALFMSLFLLFALAGNVCCLIALTHKNMDKIEVMYSFLSNICAVQVCDSILTMPLILGAAVSGSWPYGTFMCQLSAFVLNLLNVETMMALALLALDRLLAVRWPKVYGNMNRVKASLITGYAWVHGTAFTLFIVAGVIPTAYLQDCYLCSISSQTEYVYVVFFSLFCYIFPLVVILAMYGIIIKVAVDEKPTVQNFNAEVNYANRLGRRSKLWRELKRAKTVGALVVLWCLFEGPYLALQTVYLYSDSEYPSATDNVFATPVKTAFTWIRFCYPWIVPLVVIIGFPEVREELLNTCTCHKKNTVDSGRQEMLAKTGVRTSWASDASSSRPSTLGRSFQVPVLFATSGGLRLQIGNKERENDVDNAGDFHEGFYPDPRMKYDPTRSRYPPPLTPVPQSSDEDTGGSWDIRGAVGSPEPEVAQAAPHKSARSNHGSNSSDPDRVKSPSSSSSFQLSLTSRELKMHRNTPRTPNDTSHSPAVTPRQPDHETPPGSIPPSETNTPR